VILICLRWQNQNYPASPTKIHAHVTVLWWIVVHVIWKKMATVKISETQMAMKLATVKFVVTTHKLEYAFVAY
jgi:hypothetical protein